MVVLQKDGKWAKISAEEFERDYHETLLEVGTIWWFDPENLVINSAEMRAGMWIPGRGLCYLIGYHPNIVINGMPKIDAVPAGSCRVSRDEVQKDIDKYNTDRRGEMTIGWEHN